MNPSVSIITPLYNGAKHLQETIESVFAQDTRDWEWILFDDGSNDGTQQIAGSLAEKHPDSIRYFEHPGNKNHGTAFTRNRAAEKAKSEFLAFLDQDDVWHCDRLSRHLQMITEQPRACMVWSPVLYWYANREFVQPVGARGEGLSTGLYEPPSFVKIFLGSLRGTPLPSASIFRKRMFDDVSGYVESIRGSEDIVLCLKLAQKFPVYFDKEVLVKHRKHEDSTLRVARRTGKMNEWDLHFYRWVNGFLRANGYDEDTIDRNDMAYYKTIIRSVNSHGYFKSRQLIRQKLDEHPEIGKKFRLDHLLDYFLPLEIAYKVSSKIRFDYRKPKS